MIDIALLKDDVVLEAPPEAITGWLHALGHCTMAKSGGLIAQNSSRAFWHMTMPPGVSFNAVVAAGLATDDGHGNWEIYGYHSRAEAGHTGKQRGGAKGAEIRWGKSQNGKPNGIPTNGIPNGIPNGNDRVRQPERKPEGTSVSTTAGTTASRNVGTEVRQSVIESERESDSQEDGDWEPAESPPF